MGLATMRVLHVYKAYPPVIGGIENHIRTLAEGQAARGLDVTVLTTHGASRTTIEVNGNIRVIRTARLTEIASTPLSLSFMLWLKRLESDLLHLHFPYPPGETGALMFAGTRRLIITYHSDVVRQRMILRLYRGIQRRVLERADGIIATSSNYIASSSILSRLERKCTVIPHGIDVLRLSRHSRANAAEIRRRYGIPLILFVGRLRYYKGLEYLLQAMTSIDARLLVAGTGPMDRDWKSLAVRLDLGEKVSFLGDVADEGLPDLYAACDVLVLPASHRSEAFGLVQVEAMAAGRPVVSTDLGTGTSFVNRHGETGLVVPPRDPPALVQAVRALLGDAAMRRRLGEQGRQRAEREFSRDTMVERTIGLYERILGENPVCEGKA